MPLTDVILPPGVVFAYGGASAPTGYLLCDGTAVSRTTYAALFAAIGTVHGSGDGSTTFNLPDYRGRFIRGVNSGTGRDPDAGGRTAMASGGATGDNVGSVQGHAFQTHTHSQNPHYHQGEWDAFAASGAPNGGVWSANHSYSDNHGLGSQPVIANTTATNNNATASGATSQASSNESRPVNANAWYIIKI